MAPRPVVVDPSPVSKPTQVAALSYSLSASCAATLADLTACLAALSAKVPDPAKANLMISVDAQGGLVLVATWVLLA